MRSGSTRARALGVPLLAVLLGGVPLASTPAPDPLERGRPTAQEIEDSVVPIDVESSVRTVDVDGSVTGVVREDDDPALVTLDSDILFAFGSAELDPAASSALATVAAEVVGAAGAAGTVSVVGYTDSVGSDGDNLALSLARAQAVAAVLVAAIGDGSPAVTADGRGEADPVAPNESAGVDDPAGRTLNRRVEITYG